MPRPKAPRAQTVARPTPAATAATTPSPAIPVDAPPRPTGDAKRAESIRQALGGAGYTKDWPVERYWRDAKLLDIGAGTNEIRQMLIGRELIGAGA